MNTSRVAIAIAITFIAFGGAMIGAGLSTPPRAFADETKPKVWTEIQEVQYTKHIFVVRSETWPGENHPVPCTMVATVGAYGERKHEQLFHCTKIEVEGNEQYITVKEELTDTLHYGSIRDGGLKGKK